MMQIIAPSRRMVLGTIEWLLLGAALVYFVNEGYKHSWTGFAALTKANGEVVPGKTLWDWLDLLIVPLILAIAAFALDGSRKRSEQRTESDRQRQQILDDYFDFITDVLITPGVGKNEDAPGAQVIHGSMARSVARSRTLSALRQLDGGRKAALIQFIYEAGLIGKSPALNLNGADLTDADFDEATLVGCELRGARFRRASFRNASLMDSDFSGSDFRQADLTGARFTHARLEQAVFRDANLTRADLSFADMNQADTRGAKRGRKEVRIQVTFENRRKDDRRDV